MARVIKEVRACLHGEIYPRHFQVGEEVSEADAVELRKLGAVKPERKARQAAPENKAAS